MMEIVDELCLISRERNSYVRKFQLGQMTESLFHRLKENVDSRVESLFREMDSIHKRYNRTLCD